MRVVGVPVIHRHPLQSCPQVRFHAHHQIAGIATQVIELLGILRRHDEPELVPVSTTAFLKGGEVGFVGGRAVGFPVLTIAADALALDVAQMGFDRAGASLPEHNEAGLDDDAPGVRSKPATGHAGSDMAASELGGAARARSRGSLCAGLACRAQNAVNEAR